MDWEDLINWINGRKFCKGNYEFPVYVYNYPDFFTVGDYSCFRDGDIVKSGKTVLSGQTPDNVREILTKNFEE